MGVPYRPFDDIIDLCGVIGAAFKPEWAGLFLDYWALKALVQERATDMHLIRMRFGGVPPFTKPVTFKFDKRVNVFVGPNASGKSRLLSAVDEYFNERAASRRHTMTQDQFDLRLVFCEESAYFNDWTKGKNLLCGDQDFADTYFSSQTPPVIYIGPTRIGLPGISESAEWDSYGSTAEEVLSGQFCGASLKAAIDLLYTKTLEMYTEEKQEEPPTGERRAWNFLYIDEVAHSCAKSICEELLTSSRALNYPTGLDIDYISDQPLADLAGVSINRMLGIATNDTPMFDHIRPEERPIDPGGAGSKRIYVGDLSSGSQSILLWILWLAFTMLNHYEFANGWNKRPAILLIDEIENHLHPTWQRRVIPALLEHFPGLQIFATTHSPFVVAGLKAGQVHLLSRDENGVVTATTNTEDVIGWTADEILRTMMGVEDPTDDETAAAARELRQLRNEGPRSDPEDEKQRQERMQDLRQRVDRDLLAGGPWKKQRELFEEQFAEALEKYRQSQSLDQENG